MSGDDVGVIFFAAAAAAAGLCARAWLRRFRARAAGAAPRPRDLVAGNFLVLALLLSLACLGAECWFRFVYDGTDSWGLLRTSDRWFMRHYKSNNLGFRDDEDYDLGPLTATRRRVDFIGDSFTAGHGVARTADTFWGIARAARPQWQIHVFAHNGVDTGRELYFMQHEADDLAGGRYACDGVVLVYCLNDLADITPEAQTVIGRVQARRGRGIAARYSFVADWLRFLSIVRSEPDVRDYFSSLVDAYAGPAWDVQRGRLKAFHDAVTSRGGRFAVVTFPFFQDLGPDYRFRGVHRQLSEFWLSEGVPELNLLTVFDGLNAKDLVVGAFDAHPNEKAHAMAAAAIEPFLDSVLNR